MKALAAPGIHPRTMAARLNRATNQYAAWRQGWVSRNEQVGFLEGIGTGADDLVLDGGFELVAVGKEGVGQLYLFYTYMGVRRITLSRL